MKTYIVKGSELWSPALTSLLTADEWREASFDEKHIDFICATGTFRGDRRFAYNASTLKSTLDTKDSISNKWNLYRLMKERYPRMDFMAESCIARDRKAVDSLKFGKGAYILRPVQGWSGKGLMVVRDMPSLKSAIRTLKNKYTKPIVISKYLDLLLYKRKVFHMRAYFVMAKILSKTRTYLVNPIKVATAADAYDFKKVTQKRVHDSHLSNTGKDLFFPDDFKHMSDIKKKSITSQIKSILKKVSEVFKDRVGCYSETKNCFEILGADFMVTKKYKVMLLEVNYKVAFGFYSEKVKKEYSKKVMTDMVSQFIDPIFNGTELDSVKPKYWSRIM